MTFVKFVIMLTCSTQLMGLFCALSPQKPLDICVQVYRVWCQEASQALQNGTEEAIA